MYLTSSSTPLYIMSARSPGVDCRTNAGGGGPGPPLPLTPGLAAAEALAGAVYVVCTPPPGAPHPPPCIACRDLDLLPSDVCPATGCSSCRGWKKAAGPGKIKQKKLKLVLQHTDPLAITARDRASGGAHLRARAVNKTQTRLSHCRRRPLQRDGRAARLRAQPRADRGRAAARVLRLGRGTPQSPAGCRARCLPRQGR